MRTRPRRPALADVLEARCLLSVVVAESEPNNKPRQADVLSFDADGASQLSGLARNQNDRDVFTFTAPISGTLNAAVRTRNGVYADLTVEDVSGRNVLKTRPRNGVNVASGQIQAGSSYRVHLRSPAKTKVAASYLVDLLLGGTPSGGSTPTPTTRVRDSRGDDRPTRANAVALPTEGITRLEGTVTRRDRDYFSLTPQANGTLSLTVRSMNGILPKVEVQTASGASLLETEPRDGVHAGSITLTAGQTYLVRVRSAINATAAYQVDLLFRTSGAPSTSPGGGSSGGGVTSGLVAEAEPNDTKGAATRFDLGTAGAAALQGTSTSRDDRDYFIFVPDRSGLLNAAVRSTNGTFAQLEIETLAGATVAETEPNDGRNTARAIVSAGTTYFVRLRAKGQAPAAYLVDLILGDGPTGGGTGIPGGGTGGAGGGTASDSFAEVEPNDDKSTANVATIPVSGSIVLTGTSTNKDDSDFFRIQPTAGGRLSVSIATASGPLADVEVEDAATGRSILEIEPETGATTGSASIIAGGVYSIRVRAPRDLAASYRVTLTIA